MRVLHLTHYTNLYGANRSLLDLIGGLVDDGHECAVLLPGTGPVASELERLDVPWKTLPFRWWMATNRWKAPGRALMNVSALPGAVQAVREWEPDLIHTNSSVLPVGAWAAKVSSTPHVWHIREFGELDYGLRHDFGRWCFEYWLSEADARIAVSEAVRRIVLSDVERPSTVVYNGVITAEQARRLRRDRRTRSVKGPYRFAMVGLLSPAKGQETALRALHELVQDGAAPDDCELVIAGSGPDEYTDRLKGLAEELGVADMTTFLGYVDDPFEVYRRSDALIMASRCEAMGRVTVEAMAAGLPVIGRNSGGTPELVDHGETGLLYDGGADELAGRMRHLASRPDLSRQLGLNGSRVASDRFVIERYVQNVEKVYESVL